MAGINKPIELVIRHNLIRLDHSVCGAGVGRRGDFMGEGGCFGEEG